MKYDGKIKNGIELEGNCIQRIIMKILKKLSEKTEVWYSLSYDEEKHRYFDKNFLLSYLRDNYVNNKDIEPTKLSNDLITFKTYRDDVDTRVRKQSDFGQFLTILLTMITIIIDVKLNLGSKIPLVIIAVVIVIVSFIYYRCSTGNKSESAKLKCITNAIYTLETIKEDMDKNGNSRENYMARKNKYSPRAMYERKRR